MLRVRRQEQSLRPVDNPVDRAIRILSVIAGSVSVLVFLLVHFL